ncbi:MAG TPA: TolC family protein [Steroidobacteraceae bacterium]|nr:TolC family protein [Steroidobacteraceae bacterium]
MFRCVLFVCSLGVTGLAIAEPLTFDAALDLATRSSPDIAVQTASVEAAQSASVAAGRLPDPKLTVGVENFPVTGEERGSLTRDFMTMRKVGLMQDVPNAGKREARSAAAAADAERAQAERRVSILTVRRDTALAWLARYYLECRGSLFDELDRENQLFARSVQAQFAGGRGMPADVVAPKQEAAELADRRDELVSEIAKSKATLRRWAGPAGDEPLAGDPPTLALDTGHLRGHIHEHPELAVFVPMTQMAQAQVHEAEAAKRPDWGVEVAYGRRGSAFSDMVSLQFTLDLPLFARTRQDPQIAAKRQELTRVEAQRDAMFRDHTQELDAELAEYEVTTRQLARLREAHLPLAQQKVDYQFASYRAGKADLTAVLSARRELIDERLKEIELDGKRAATAAKLYFFYGAGATDPKPFSKGEGSR